MAPDHVLLILHDTYILQLIYMSACSQPQGHRAFTVVPLQRTLQYLASSIRHMLPGPVHMGGSPGASTAKNTAGLPDASVYKQVALDSCGMLLLTIFRTGLGPSSGDFESLALHMLLV